MSGPENHGPSIGEQMHAMGGGHGGGGHGHSPHSEAFSAQDIMLGSEPQGEHLGGELPTSIGDAPLKVPFGDKDADTIEFGLGNSEPFGLSKEAMIGLHEVKSGGDIDPSNIGIDKSFNINPQGMDVDNALSSGPSHGGH